MVTVPGFKGFNEAGSDVYVGIKNNMVRRQSEWRGTYDISRTTGGLTRNQARAIEQVIIKNNPNYLNKINSISPSNPNYQQVIDWGTSYLENLNR